MAKTRDMIRSQNHDNRKRFKTCDNASWSDLDHDVLFMVMMQLGCIDFLAFSEVCKAWRSLALSNKKKFMASTPPMLMWIQYRPDNNECYIEDFEGRKYKTPFPHSAHRTCVGLTCGYLILLGLETKDFWLVNPITRHELSFPCVPHFDAGFIEVRPRVVLVFSPTSISGTGWVLVMTYRLSDKIWFSIAGKVEWSYVSSTVPILDLHVFKGKIYALNKDWGLCEMSLNPEHPKLTLLEIKNCLKPCFFRPKFVSLAGEKLYVVDHIPEEDQDLYMVHELDFGKMKWVLPEEKTIGEEYAFFLSISWNGTTVNYGSTVKLDPRVHSQYKIYDCFADGRKGRLFATKNMWYFPHECMNVNHIDES